MAIMHIDGFDAYPAGIDLGTHPLGMSSNGWTVDSLTFQTFTTIPEGNGRCLHIILGGGHNVTFRFFFTARVGVIIGFRFRIQALVLASFRIDFLSGVTVRAIASISTGTLSIAGVSGTFPFVLNQWYHAEIAYLSTGAIIWIDGIEWARFTGGLTTIDAVRVSGSTPDSGSTNFNIHLDDLYILDTTGTVANSRLGPQARIEFLRPGASGQHTGWTFTGTNAWQSSNAFDAHHIIGTAAGSRITMPLTDLEGTGALHIQAARFVDVSQNSHSNPLRTVRQVVMNGATPVFVGVDDQPPAINWRRRRTWVNTNPATGQQWTGSEINAAEIGLEVV